MSRNSSSNDFNADRLYESLRLQVGASLANDPTHSHDIVGWIEEYGYGEDVEVGQGMAPIRLQPHQKRILQDITSRDARGKFPYTTVVYSCPKKSGKCLAFGSPFVLADGSVVPVETLIGRQFMLRGFDENTLESRPMEAIAEYNGVKPCWRLRTNFGREIVATREHPLFGLHGWKPINAFEVGDKLALMRNFPDTRQEYLSDEDIKLLAYFIGDGSVTTGVAFAQVEGPVLDEMRSVVAGRNLKMALLQPGLWRISGRRGKRENTIQHLLRDHAVLGKNSFHKSIPDVIFRSSHRQIALFLNRLFACDGWASVPSDGNIGGAEIGYCSISRELAWGVQHLLHRLGLNFRFGIKKGVAGRHSDKAYVVYSNNAEVIQNFAECINIFGKEAAVARVLERKSIKAQKRVDEWEVLPRQVWEELQTVCRARGMAYTELGAGEFDPKTHAARKDRIYRAAQRLGDEYLVALCESNLVWDKVKSVEYIGELPTVAIEVPESGAYINTFVEHNTTMCGLYTQWFAWNEGAPTEIFVLANDQEQAQGRIFTAVWKSLYWNPATRDIVSSPLPGKSQDRIVMPNGTYIQTLSNDYASAAGSNHSLTVYSELWAYTSERSKRLWDEMTPVPTRKNSIRFVETYAGFSGESHILEELYLSVVKEENLLYPDGFEVDGEWYDGPLPVYVDQKARTYIYWDEERRMPWQQDPAYYEAELLRLGPAGFARLHMNKWVSSSDMFITQDMWDACVRAPDDPIWSFATTLPETFACDASTKKDATALVSVSYEPNSEMYFVRRHKVWEAEEHPDLRRKIIDLEETLEKTVREQCAARNVNAVYYDPFQLHSIAIRLQKEKINMIEFPQMSKRMIADANLYDIIAQKRLVVYPDPTLESHVLKAKTEVYKEGRSRLTKGGAGTNKIDLAVALSMAAYGAEEQWRTGPRWKKIAFVSTENIKDLIQEKTVLQEVGEL